MENEPKFLGAAEAAKMLNVGVSTIGQVQENLKMALRWLVEHKDLTMDEAERRMYNGEKELLGQYLGFHIPFLLIGDPGVAKTASVKEVVRDLNKELGEGSVGYREIELGAKLPGAFEGIPVTVETDKGKEIELRLPNELPKMGECEEVGVLFLDEVTMCDESQVLPAMKFTEVGRSIGTLYTLPPHWIVVAAGNGPNCSNFSSLNEALIQRCDLYVISPSMQGYMDFINKRALYFPDNILAFLKWKPERLLCRADEDMSDYGHAGATPRTWDLLAQKLSTLKLKYGDNIPVNVIRNAATGTIGDVVAVEFAAFCKFYEDKDRPDVDEILAGTSSSDASKLGEQTFFIASQGILSQLNTDLDKLCNREGFTQKSGVKANFAVLREVVTPNGFEEGFDYETIEPYDNKSLVDDSDDANQNYVSRFVRGCEWIMGAKKLECSVSFIKQLKDTYPFFCAMLADDGVVSSSQVLTDFFENETDFLIQNQSELL